MTGLQQKTALVTGGSRGIGSAIVERFVNEGTKTYFTYNSGAEQALALAERLGELAIPLQMNVTDSASIETGIKQILESSEGIDFLINNAGITKDNLIIRMSEQDWDAVIDTNLKGAFLCCKAVIRPMMSRRTGRIVNIGSVVGITGNAGQANYVASKAGLIGLTKSLAREVASRNILVNCIAPGYVTTDMTEKLTEEQRNAFLQSIPLKRAAAPSEIAGVTAFLCSNEAAYITGQVLTVDGGLAM